MANYINKYDSEAAYTADNTKQYPNVSLVNGTLEIVATQPTPPTPTGDTYVQYSAGDSISGNFKAIRISQSVADQLLVSHQYISATLACCDIDSPTATIGYVCTGWDSITYDCFGYDIGVEIYWIGPDMQPIYSYSPMTLTDGYYVFDASTSGWSPMLIVNDNLPFDIEVIPLD